MFLKDKVLPKHINDFIINKSMVRKIKSLFSIEFLSNLYIYGPSGCGKYSLFIKNLEEIVDKEIVTFSKTITLNNTWSTSKETSIISSEFHFEINLSKYSNNKNNLFSLIDALTNSKEVNSLLPYKLIVIRNIHTASTEFIKFIKQKSEQLNEHIRFILIGKTNSNNLNVLNGCFFSLRLGSPATEEIFKVLKKFIKKKIKDQELYTIINDLDRNLSRIYAKVEMILLTTFYKTRVEITSEQIYKLLIDKKFASLYEIRDHLYEYQVHNENMPNLLNSILNLLVNSDILNESKKIKLGNIIATIDISLQKSYKEIIHLEHGFFRIFKLIHTD